MKELSYSHLSISMVVDSFHSHIVSMQRMTLVLNSLQSIYPYKISNSGLLSRTLHESNRSSILLITLLYFTINQWTSPEGCFRFEVNCVVLIWSFFPSTNKSASISFNQNLPGSGRAKVILFGTTVFLTQLKILLIQHTYLNNTFSNILTINSLTLLILLTSYFSFAPTE